LKGSRRAAHSALSIAPRRSPLSAKRCCCCRKLFDRYSEIASKISAPVAKPTEILKIALPKTLHRR
jgi:hypothetical protein